MRLKDTEQTHSLSRLGQKCTFCRTRAKGQRSSPLAACDTAGGSLSEEDRRRGRKKTQRRHLRALDRLLVSEALWRCKYEESELIPMQSECRESQLPCEQLHAAQSSPLPHQPGSKYSSVCFEDCTDFYPD